MKIFSASTVLALYGDFLSICSLGLKYLERYTNFIKREDCSISSNNFYYSESLQSILKNGGHAIND